MIVNSPEGTASIHKPGVIFLKSTSGSLRHGTPAEKVPNET